MALRSDIGISSLGRLPKPPRWVYPFGEAGSRRRDLLGGKGAELGEMTTLGMPVPPGFTITTEACREYYRRDRMLPQGLWAQVLSGLQGIEASTGLRFGDPARPLLVSVRSGAAISMPGMMDTILNLGISADVAAGIGRDDRTRRFALDLHRRFIQMFASVAMGVEGVRFHNAYDRRVGGNGPGPAHDPSPGELEQVIATFERIVKEATG